MSAAVDLERCDPPAGYPLSYEPSYILRGLAALELDVARRA